MLLGDIIKQYRSEHNLSMQNFADLIHSSKSYVSMLERNFNPSTGKPISPSLGTLKLISEAINIDIDTLLKMLDDGQEIILNEEKFKEQFDSSTKIKPKAIKVPVLGYVRAGIPLEAIEEILDYEEIPAEWANDGSEYFGLTVKGDSMFPYIIETDVIIFKKTNTCETGDIAAVLVNGDEATVKLIKREKNGITLTPFNPMYPKMFYTNEDIINKPVQIIGVLKELRRKNFNT